MAERAGYNTVIKISGAATSMTGEATTTADNTVYQISNVAKQVLDLDTPPTVLDGGVETTEDYTVNYLNGKITFGTADGDRVITITGKYMPMTVAAYAHMASISRACDLLDKTAFGTEYKNKLKGLLSASGTLSQFDVADTLYTDALITGKPIVIEHRGISTDEPDRYYALLESDEVAAAVDGLQDETISWVSYDYWIRAGA